jgi:hypothetical protein
MGGVGISHTTVSVFFISVWNLLLWFHKLYRMYMFFTHTSHLCSLILNILYNYIFIWIQSQMLVNARSEFIWVLNLVIIRCVYSIILLYLYYQLFIHQNYTRSAHILKRGIFSFEVLIESSRLENRTFGSESDGPTCDIVSIFLSNPAILLFVFYFWIIYL